MLYGVCTWLLIKLMITRNMFMTRQCFPFYIYCFLYLHDKYASKADTRTHARTHACIYTHSFIHASAHILFMHHKQTTILVTSTVRCSSLMSFEHSRRCAQVGNETSNVGDGGTDEKTGGGDGGGRVEDVTISLGVTRMDKVRNEYIRGTAQVGRFGEKTREARLRWYGHVLRKDDVYNWEKDAEDGIARKEETGKA